MMVLLPSLLLILACLSGSFGQKDLENKVFVFPVGNKKASVKVNVSLQHPLTNFTVCMRFNPSQTLPYTLFSYSTKANAKDFQIIKPNSIMFHLQIGGMTHSIAPRKPSLWEWQHLCVAWDSTTGLVHFWHNGELLSRFVMQQGYKISQNGTFLLGHDRDSWGKKDSFVGEMADVNMWPRVLKPDEIHLVRKNDEVPNPLFTWWALNYTCFGGIRVEEALHQVSCVSKM